MRIARRATVLATTALVASAAPALAQSGGFQLDPAAYASMSSNSITGFGPSLSVEYVTSTSLVEDAGSFEGYASNTFAQVFGSSQLSVSSSTYQAEDAPSVAFFGFTAGTGVMELDMSASGDIDYVVQIDDRIGDTEAIAIVATPEPATATLLGWGFAGLFAISRRRRRTA
jgi:hypothetical protein